MMKKKANKKDEIQELLRVTKLTNKPRLFLKEIIMNRNLAFLFREFLHKNLCSENFSCYFQIQMMKMTTDQAKLKEMTEHIFHTYVVNGSPQQVNLTSKVRSGLLDSLDKIHAGGQVTKNVFFKLEREVQTLMERDSIYKFHQSAMFRDFVEGLEKGEIRVDLKTPYLQRSNTITAMDHYFARRQEEIHLKDQQVSSLQSSWIPYEVFGDFDVGKNRVINMCQLDDSMFVSLSGGSLSVFTPEVVGTYSYSSLIKANRCETHQILLSDEEKGEAIFVTEGGTVIKCGIEDLKLSEISRIKTDSANSAAMFSGGILVNESDILLVDTLGYYTLWNLEKKVIVMREKMAELLLSVAAVGANFWFGGLGKVLILGGNGREEFLVGNKNKTVNAIMPIFYHQQVWLGSEDGSIEVRHPESKDLICVLKQHFELQNAVKKFCLHPDQETVFSGDGGGNVIIWSSPYLLPLQVLKFPDLGAIRSLKFCNNMMWIGGRRSQVIICGPGKEKAPEVEKSGGGWMKKWVPSSSSSPLSSSSPSPPEKKEEKLKIVDNSDKSVGDSKLAEGFTRTAKIHRREKREAGGNYNPRTYLLHSCMANDIMMVRYLVEFCDIDPRHLTLRQGESSNPNLHVGDTPISVAQRHDCNEVLGYLKSLPPLK
eukprot:CAMPEP_0201518344 /NCGR_PEP_ID=MMETSP0161_2-20130828/9226_1 /ASSEMBLY_ACC=CAM_ASM_000251 /TAXON_ID=180227 /ORGANISM="Neoparamoeba aestuarina, Strain SoJaBio B1-5/56/2" /LENGTH=652 /DNA_ID=CAMNT_0047916107 /DNA_START=45 /DNA_END=2003 /DNA_ORIENTATION=+